MFLLTFTKLRKRIFIALLTAFIGIPLLILFLFLLRIPVFSSTLFGIAFLGLGFYFFLPAAITWAIFGYGHFFEGDISIAPNGVAGVIITLIFYSAAAVLFSLVGNFKKDAERVPWREAISKRYLKILFLSIAGAVIISIAAMSVKSMVFFPPQVKDDTQSSGQAFTKPSCDALEKVIKSQIEVANYCSVDADCAIEQFGVCPFGCYNFVNQNVDTSAIKNLLGAYTSRCPECVYKCTPPPLPEERRCRGNKCVDARNDTKPKPEAVHFPSIYYAYASAVQSEDLDKMKQYITQAVWASMEKMFAESDMEKRKERFAFLKLSAPFQPDAVQFGAQVVENNKGILRIETEEKQTNQYSKVQNPRSYGTLFFIKENDEWKMDKQFFVSYKDPTPLFPTDVKNPITFLWHPQFHANHTASPAECANEPQWSDHCYWNWAVLKRDPSLCGKIFDDSGTDKIQGYHSLQRFNCFQDVAQLIGDESLCELTGGDRIKTDEFFASRVKSCKASVSYRDFFANTNIYTIDSDGDGLTDMQEAYFNTSLANTDTDHDGVNDAKEVKNDRNPLGNGKLGDHLLNNAIEVIRVKAVLHPVRTSGAISTERTDEGIRALFQETQKIWSQAGIAFDVTLREIAIDVDGAPVMNMGNYPFFADIVAKANDGVLHVYYVRDMAGANGWIVGARHIAVADITTVDDFRATAHEIGHVFGLGHTEDNMESLMASGRNGQKFSEGEIRRVRGQGKNF